jgi:oxygen-independent coproporphyrinogen-3 oxidase
LASIYIHIPFCKQACHYCNFHFSTSLKNKEAIVDAISLELSLKSNGFSETIDSIYFGGGTPSLLDINDFEILLNKIHKKYSISESVEITVECNPDDIYENKLIELKKMSINRLSIGVQSFVDEELKLMNRSHDSKIALESISKSKNLFENISIDLMYGLPNSNFKNWEFNLNTIDQFNLNHISAYAITVEPKTALESYVKKQIIKMPDDDFVHSQFNLLYDFFTNKNYINYELNSFSKENYFSKNNSSYWLRKQYIGVGPSAHSYNGYERSWNISNNKKYIDDIKNKILFSGKETLSKVDRYNEYLMTGLRTVWGVSLDLLESDFGEKFKNHFLENSREYVNSDLIIENNGVYTTTKKGKFLADGIASNMFIIDLN